MASSKVASATHLSRPGPGTWRRGSECGDDVLGSAAGAWIWQGAAAHTLPRWTPAMPVAFTVSRRASPQFSGDARS
jgi:hypothetical protein